MEQYLIEMGYIPLDKSWTIRMGVLDLLNGYDDTARFLERQEQLSDDLRALYRASLAWKSDEAVDVGESATLYRFLKFASWKLGLKKRFVIHDSLILREVCNKPEIINYSADRLLKLDNGTSQWASAAVLLGSQERIADPPYKLKLTYEAVEHWKQQRDSNQCWIPRYDDTILIQAETFLKLLGKEKTDFVPKQAEDYCFARAFGYMTKEKGATLWPSLLSHESNRIREMEKVLYDAERGKEIFSRDHRIVQAIAMRQKIRNREVKMRYHYVVNKSWPQFWKFLDDSSKILSSIMS